MNNEKDILYTLLLTRIFFYPPKSWKCKNKIYFIQMKKIDEDKKKHGYDEPT